MPRLLYSLLLIALFTACGKDNNSPRVDFYLLSSYKVVIDTATKPVRHTIVNPVLSDVPLIANHEIISYSQSTRTFKLARDVGEIFKDHNNTNAFAVAINKEPVYYGIFHAGYLSSLIIGLPTVDPIMTFGRELPIGYISLTGSTELQKLDRRNDIKLTRALKATGRLK